MNKKTCEMEKHDTRQENILQEFVHVSNIFNYHCDAQRQKWACSREMMESGD